MRSSPSSLAHTSRSARAALLALSLFALVSNLAAADTFDCFEGCGDPLEGSVCTQGVAGDWHTNCGAGACPDAGSDVTVLSFHGGSIESHTSVISAQIAALFGWNRYDLSGHLTTNACQNLAIDGNPSNNNHEVLHITATAFNHAEALTLVGAHPNAVAIHGCGASCSDETICIGGRATEQIQDLQAYFQEYDHLLPYTVYASTVPAAGTPFCGANIGGTASLNLVNRTSTGEGLQLEMSLDVRASLASGLLGDDLLRGLLYGGIALAMGELPTPLATLDHVDTYSVNGTTYERFFLEVENRSEYPEALFDPAPTLPPCGLNVNSARTWVKIYDAATDAYLYGFCSLVSPNDLAGVWFARPQGTAPAAVYLTLEDRETGETYRSNRVAL